MIMKLITAPIYILTFIPIGLITWINKNDFRLALLGPWFIIEEEPKENNAYDLEEYEVMAEIEKEPQEIIAIDHENKALIEENKVFNISNDKSDNTKINNENNELEFVSFEEAMKLTKQFLVEFSKVYLNKNFSSFKKEEIVNELLSEKIRFKDFKIFEMQLKKNDLDLEIPVIEMNKEDLREILKKLNIKGVSSLNKIMLFNKINEIKNHIFEDEINDVDEYVKENHNKLYEYFAIPAKRRNISDLKELIFLLEKLKI